MATHGTRKQRGRQGAKPSKLPHVAAATFCDQVIEGKDNVLTAVRVVDQVRVSAPQQIAAKVPVQVPTLLVILRSGSVTGEHTIGLVHRSPTGESLPPLHIPAIFPGEELGPTVVVRIPPFIAAEGLHWFDVTFAGRVLSRVPLRLTRGEAS